MKSIEPIIFYRDNDGHRLVKMSDVLLLCDTMIGLVNECATEQEKPIIVSSIRMLRDLFEDSFKAAKPI